MCYHDHLSFLLFSILLFNLPTTKSSTCTLDFEQFKFQVQGDCFDMGPSPPQELVLSCCQSALEHIYKTLAMRANISRTIFLDPAQAQDCDVTFQGLHPSANLSNCGLHGYISSSSSATACSRDVDSMEGLLGVERYNVLKSSCGNLSTTNYTDQECSSCATSFTSSTEALEEGNGGRGEPSGRRVCAEALFISLASSNAGSVDLVQGIFSCLWDEIKIASPKEQTRKGNRTFKEAVILASIVISISLVVLAPLIYVITRKHLRYASRKEMEDLSVVALKKSLEDDYTSRLYFPGLYVISQGELANATNNFNISNQIGEGSMGKVYLGIMPSGQKVAIKKFNEDSKLHDFDSEICKIASLRHPNLVSILGYCHRGGQYLVSEYCVNGNLASWVLANQEGGRETLILTWEQRMQIAIGIIRGLWFLQNNPLQKNVHGSMKMTNVLLDEKLEARLADFTLSCHKYMEMNGINPQNSYQALVGLADDDIYNFGVLLLQLLTGKKAVGLSASRSSSILNEARNIVKKEGNVSAMADPRLNGIYNPIAFRRILSVAVHCIDPSVDEKPSLEEILQKLQEAQTFI